LSQYIRVYVSLIRDQETAGGGRVYKCLFNHKFNAMMSKECRDALTVRQKLLAKDYKVSESL